MDVATIVLAIGTLLGGGGSVFLWLETHGVGTREKRRTEAKTIVDTALGPVKVDLHDIHAQLESDRVHNADVIKAAMSEALVPVRDQLSVLNTKIEPLWAALINMGLNQTNVLHQPDPRRAEIDGLLEQLQDELRNGNLMSAPDYMKLRRFLTTIKSWEPGQDVGFPVLPAEPTSAAILLSVMGLSRQRRRQGQV